MDKIKEEFMKCTRTVPKRKNVDVASKDFWHKIFEQHDHDLNIPLHRKIKVLNEVFPPDLLKEILQILPSTKSHIPDPTPVQYSPINANESSIIPDIRETLYLEQPRGSLVDYRKQLTQEPQDMGEKNMYINFLNMPETYVSRWRPKPPVTFTGMNLSEQCQVITQNIANEFVEWLKGLGGDEETTLDVNAILNLFEIGFNADAADTLCVKMKELLSVTTSVAKARHMPEASYTAHLYKELCRDINLVRRNEENFAFGTMLPIEMRKPPQKENIATKWIENKRVPENIAGMAVIWKGIEHLRSTLGYCKWLREHSEIEPPKYLLEAGLLGKKEAEIAVANRSVSHIMVQGMQQQQM